MSAPKRNHPNEAVKEERKSQKRVKESKEKRQLNRKDE